MGFSVDENWEERGKVTTNLLIFTTYYIAFSIRNRDRERESIRIRKQHIHLSPSKIRFWKWTSIANCLTMMQFASGFDGLHMYTHVRMFCRIASSYECHTLLDGVDDGCGVDV